MSFQHTSRQSSQPHQSRHPHERSPDTSFQPELVTAGTRSGIRAVIALTAALAVIIPLSFGGVMFAQALQTRHEIASAEFSPSTSDLLVDVPFGGVDIRTTSEPEARVDMEYFGSKVRPELRVDEGADGRTVITVDTDAQFVPGGTRNLQVVVAVPEASAAAMRLEARSDVSRLSISGEFDEVNATSTVGAIDTWDLKTRTLTVETDAGAVTLSGEHEVINAKADFGSISGEDLTVSRELTVAAEVGSIDIGLGTETLPLGGITARTSAGSIDLMVPRIASVASTDAIGYTVNSSAQTGSHDIRIDTTHAADGQVTIPIDVRSQSGYITVEYRDEDSWDDTDGDDEFDGDGTTDGDSDSDSDGGPDTDGGPDSDGGPDGGST